MAGKKKKTAKGKATGRGVMGFAVSATQRNQIKAKAKALANGNLSDFIRHAALTCKTKAPKK